MTNPLASLPAGRQALKSACIRLFVCFILFYNSNCLAEIYQLEPIVVTASMLPSSFLSQGRSVSIIEKEEIQNLPAEGIADILGYIGSVDLRRRSVGGVQGDIGIRGSTFEQVLILLDGVRVNDPQTGHFNLDLPITKADIERIEILHGGGSNIYGPGSFSGAINIVTKRPAKEKGVEIAIGEHSLKDARFWVEFPVRDFKNRFSLENTRASAYRPETEFEITNASFSSGIKSGDKEFNLLFGLNAKDFGADSFYSARYPRQEEHTDTKFLKVGGKFEIKDLKFDSNVYFRRHWDKFILDRTNPAINVNFHTNYVSGLTIKAYRDFDFGKVAIGTEFINEEITSTNLGGHERHIVGSFFAFRPDFGEKLFLDAGARLDKSPMADLEISPNINFAYKLYPSFKLRGSFSRSFRTPTFTDLYYRDPANAGNPNLTPEENFDVETGFDYLRNKDLIQFTIFERFSSDLIDWTRTDTVWNAQNIGNVNTKGIEAQFSKNIENPFIESLSFDYTFLDSKKTSDYISKYALAYLEHQANVGIENKLPFGFKQLTKFIYKQRIYQDKYFLIDARISKKKEFENFDAEYFIDVTNLTNTSYEEISDSPAPGRWIKSGIRIEF